MSKSVNPIQTKKQGRASASSDLFVSFVGLTAGNFACELCADQDWAAATERSFFQFVALLAVWIVGFIHQPNDEMTSTPTNAKKL